MVFFLLLLLLLAPLLPEASSFSPVDHYLINSGSSSPLTLDYDNRPFTGDDSPGFRSSSPVSLTPTRSVSVMNPNPNPNPSSSISPIYNSARIFTRPSSYAFTIKHKGAHLLRLHFNWLNSTQFNPIDARFHVSAGAFLLLSDFNGAGEASIKEFIVPVEVDSLLVSFVPSDGSKLGFVNAIELISAPKDLILDVAQLVDSSGAVKFSGFARNALEVVQRVNVGGPKVTPFNDSLWRTWIADDSFLDESSGEPERVHFSGPIAYRAGGASREVAPDSVYNTARVIRSKDEGLSKSKIVLNFAVMKGFRYLVRVHFCDIASLTSGRLVFNVYVNGYLAEENVQPDLAFPFYADLVVDGDTGSGFVSVSVGPSKWSDPRDVDAILNGVEVMKVNNSMGSLDGEISADSILETHLGVGYIVPVIAVVCFLVFASVLLQRRMFGARDSGSWSRIPVEVSELKAAAR